MTISTQNMKSVSRECFPASVYPVLGQGGKWDERKDPFAMQ
jgi:hypothetical protein